MFPITRNGWDYNQQHVLHDAPSVYLPSDKSFVLLSNTHSTPYLASPVQSRRRHTSVGRASRMSCHKISVWLKQLLYHKHVTHDTRGQTIQNIL